jgi:hypothetical protein
MNNLLKDQAVALIDGHVLIKDYDSGQVLLDKHNAINYINISLAIASLLGGEQDGSSGSFEISEMHFGNGGSVIDSSGNIQYKTPNTNSEDGELYYTTYTKSVADVDAENKVDVIKYYGEVYSDIVVTCTLAYNEPSGQQTLDDSTSMNGDYTFDELGLVTESGKFISHIVFHPIEKSENRKIQVIYTLRIRAGS